LVRSRFPILYRRQLRLRRNLRPLRQHLGCKSRQARCWPTASSWTSTAQGGYSACAEECCRMHARHWHHSTCLIT